MKHGLCVFVLGGALVISPIGAWAEITAPPAAPTKPTTPPKPIAPPKGDEHYKKPSKDEYDRDYQKVPTKPSEDEHGMHHIRKGEEHHHHKGWDWPWHKGHENHCEKKDGGHGVKCD